MSKSYWLVKQEPSSYSWETFVKERGTAWSGVRSYPARNHLRAMAKGDLVFFYHSGDSKEVVGLARVSKEAYADPTAEAGEGEWSAVDLEPVEPLRRPVSLHEIKTDKVLKEMPFVRQSRLSVSPLTPEQFRRLSELARTELKLPPR
jgi:predicted RNA-binding protein with PUA-like domain